MNTKFIFNFGLFLIVTATGCVSPKLPGVGAAVQERVDAGEIAGAVTVVVTKDKLLHLETTGWSDIEAKKPMQPDTLSGSPR